MMRSPGRHRLEAACILGWEDIPAVLSDGTETEAKLWEIAENRSDHLNVTETISDSEGITPATGQAS